MRRLWAFAAASDRFDDRIRDDSGNGADGARAGRRRRANRAAGRAVIGGLLASMFATLFVLPGVFAWILGRWTVKSVSLDPADPDGPHFVKDGVA